MTLSQSHFGLKDISGEAWTKAFKMSTIRRGGEAGAGVTLHRKSDISAPFYLLFSSHIVGAFGLKYL